VHSRDRFIQLGDVRLRLRIEGVGPGLLLLHGWALDSAMWQPQFAALVQRHQLIAIDRRGFGLSSGEPDLVREIDDVRALLDALAIERTAILGVSQAARVALQFAQRFPQRVSCLIIDGPPHLTDASAGAALPADVPIADYRKLVQEEGMEAFRRRWLQHPFMQLHAGKAQMQSLLTEMVARYPGRDLQRDAALAPTFEADLWAVDVLTLVVNGELDSATRLIAGEELAQRLPNARHVLIRDAGHLPNLDQPVAYNELVLDFLHDRTSAPIVGIA
jgi:pimeloyl-ACP methyl ester carboxylesterase